MIDADDKVEGNFTYPEDFGQDDGYALWIHRGDFNWWRHQMFRTGIGWEYIGVIHEYANCSGKETPHLENFQETTILKQEQWVKNKSNLGMIKQQNIQKMLNYWLIV